MVIWTILWILFMAGLVAATVIVSFKESRARALATKQIMGGQAGIPMTEVEAGSTDMPSDPLAADGFGQTDVEFAQFDEKNFK